MLERIYLWFIEKPQRLMSAGALLVVSGGLLLVAAAVGHVMLLVAAMGKPSENTLAALFPSLPTFIVPETIPGAIGAVILVLLGLFLHATGRRVYQQFQRRW